MEILDIHSHGPAPRLRAVVALGLEELRGGVELLAGQAYSVGIHPWDTGMEIPEELWQQLEATAQRREVVAIGECGIDTTPKSGPMFRQLTVLKRHVEISERVHKPMILHDVKGDEIIIGLRRDLKPKQNWCIHGFRRKGSVAEMLLRAGLWLSYGSQFNSEALRSTPIDKILSETDESTESIAEIISRLDETYGREIPIAQNIETFLKSI